jgi:hypothetical protein
MVPFANSANIICWEDADGNWALSFNKIESCAEFRWTMLTLVGRLPSSNTTQWVANQLTAVQLAGENAQADECHLPSPEYGNLEQVSQFLEQAIQNFAVKKTTAIDLEKNDNLPKLFEIFEKSRDLDDENNLKLLAQIFRRIGLKSLFSAA